jgi:hypothetical protein
VNFLPLGFYALLGFPEFRSQLLQLWKTPNCVVAWTLSPGSKLAYVGFSSSVFFLLDYNLAMLLWFVKTTVSYMLVDFLVVYNVQWVDNGKFIFLIPILAWSRVSAEILMVLVGDSYRYLASNDQRTTPEFMTKNKLRNQCICEYSSNSMVMMSVRITKVCRIQKLLEVCISCDGIISWNAESCCSRVSENS